MKFAQKVVIALGSLAWACGGAPEAAPPTVPRPTLDAGQAAAPVSVDDGTNAKAEPPFAGSTAEATAMISSAVDKRRTEIGICVRDFRKRKKMAHERVAVSFGIDQEGKLLGVTSKGKEDGELKTCVQEAVKGAPFPRSHAGVITITKTYEELVFN